MTENEAIHDFCLEIEKCYLQCEGACCQVVRNKCHCRDAIILDSLEEIQQYRAIGTVDKCREAVERQKLLTPDVEGDGYADADGKLIYDTWICPCCREHYEIDYDDYDYCPKCGQHIEKVWKDWNDLDE